MCIILDISCFHKFKDDTNEDIKPVRKWFGRRNNKFVYAPTNGFKSEWENSSERRNLLRQWRQAGKLKQENAEEVEKETKKLKSKTKSNDPHIIALARIAKVNVLVSDDGNFQKDFKDKKLVENGSVYKNRSHQHLLRPDMCP